MSNIWIAPIRGYQYISRMLPASCRYYPTCSEYAKWQFEFNKPHRAFYETTKRILRCNQLFIGGVDYPVIIYKRPKLLNLIDFNRYLGKIKIQYWAIPTLEQSNNRYYILKDLNETTIPSWHALTP